MFEFREEDHSYWLDGRRLESVTEILERSGISDYRWSNEEAMERGTFVHTASEMIDRGALDWESLDPVLVPYCTAYQRFMEDFQPEIILSELPLYHPQHLFAGKMDRVVIMNAGTVLIDLKTGVPNRSTAIQLSAYRELVKANGYATPTKCFSLHLRDDGAYRLNEIEDHRRNFNVFLAALTVVRWRKEAV